MKTMRMWQIKVVASIVLMLAWSGQVRGDFSFGEPVNLGSTINSSDYEYDPAISTDGLELYFPSPRSGGYGDYDIYVAIRATTDDPWSQSVNLGSLINSSGMELGPNISADGLSLYFSSSCPGGSGQSDLYVTTRQTVQDPWGEPLNLGPIVNSSFHDMNPSITADGLSLFFSDWDGATPRPGGVGQCDIWMTQRASLSEPWNRPVNLGPPLNGPLVEGAPDICSDGRVLFFSGYLSGTDWDLWFVKQNIAATWGAPVNLGPPVNGYNPDINPCISADGRMLYFSSFRPGGRGNTDIWQVPVIPTVDLNTDGIVDSVDMCIMVDHSRIPSAGLLQSQSVITDGNWHHIGMVWDGYVRMLYVDGMNVTQDEQTNLEGKQSGLFIGAGARFEAAGFFWGLIDDVRLYDVAMRTEQIEAILR